MNAPDLSPGELDALRYAVNAARNENVRSASELRTKLEAAGFAKQVVDGSLRYWALHIKAQQA